MQYAFSSNAFRRYSLFEAADAIAKTGYSGIELMCDRPHAYPEDLPDGWASQFLSYLKRLAIRISNLNAFTLEAIGDTYNPSWIDPDESRRRLRIKHTIACIRLARALRAPSVSTEPGGLFPKTLRRNQRQRAALLDIFEDGLRKVLPVAEECKVKLLIEPEPGCLIETSDQIKEFMARFNSRWIGINFDIGHSFCVGEDPAKVIPELSNLIGHFHFEDIGADRKHHHLLPGKGAIKLDRVLDAIADTGYMGFITVELYPYQKFPKQAAADALDYIFMLRRVR